MLSHLYLKNFLLVEEISLNFKNGLTVFTGETGAGKSMIIESILLLKGEKTDWKLFEKERGEIVIEGVFKLNENFKDIFEKYELPFEENTIVQRILIPENKISKFRINGITVSLSIVKEIFDNIIEIHGQHSQIMLLSKDYQLSIFDNFVGIGEKVKKFLKDYREFKNLQNKLKEIEKEYQRIISMREFMEHSIKEMENLKLEELDEEKIFEEFRNLNSKKEFKQKISEIFYTLYEDENSVLNKLGTILREIENFKEGIGKKFFSLIEEAYSILKEGTFELSELKFEEQEDERKLTELEKILEKIEELKRKHRTNFDGLKMIYKKFKEDLNKILKLEKEIYETDNLLKEKEKKLKKEADFLSKKRREKIPDFENKLEQELKKLGFSYTNFKVKLKERELYERGKEEIFFLFSSIPDKEPKELTKTVSGGELSRIMLALKSLLSEEGLKELLIFDEVDVGIGGKQAKFVGEKLKIIGQKKQVFCITHLPQIACFADNHFYVYKYQEGNKITVKVKELLTPEEREREIARMISGEKITKTSLEHAKSLLKEVSL